MRENSNILKIFYKPGFENEINFIEIREMVTFSKKFNKLEHSYSEFFIKYTDFWIGGMEMYGYFFTMVVDSSVDIDHFKIQMMAMFETISKEIE